MELTTNIYRIKAISGSSTKMDNVASTNLADVLEAQWQISGMNGHRVVGSFSYFLTALPVLWDGTTQVLDFMGSDGTPKGFGQIIALCSGVSSDGTIVGSRTDAPYVLLASQGFVRKADGSTNYLGPLFGAQSSGLSCISDSGAKAAGYLWNTAEHNLVSELFSLDIPTNTMVRHNVILAGGRNPVQINDHGDIVGTTQANSGFLVKNGVPTEFGADTSVIRITNNGLIGGNSPSGAWIADSSRPLDVLIQIPKFIVHDISEDGQIAVGAGSGGAMIWTPTKGLQDLNERVESYTGWHLEVARFINSEGQFVGEGTQRGEHGLFNFLATPEMDRTRIDDPPQPDLLWPIWLELPQAFSGLDPAGLDVLRGLMLHQLGQTLGDDNSRKAIKRASLQAIERALDRLRRGT